VLTYVGAGKAFKIGSVGGGGGGGGGVLRFPRDAESPAASRKPSRSKGKGEGKEKIYLFLP